MTTRQKALAASSPGIGLLLVGLGWWAVDALIHRGDFVTGVRLRL